MTAMEANEIITPAALQKGDTIGVIAPSSVYDIEKLKPAVARLEDAGFHIKFHPQTAKKHGQFAGPPAQKVAALHDFFSDPLINAIFTTCGGNGAIHLLDLIDFDLIRQNPKIFIGFSDITILLNAISAKTGLVTFHGPTLTRIDKIESSFYNQMLALLMGQSDHVEIKNSSSHNISGTLYGGNLSVFQTLIGTSYAPNLVNSLLLLEDINDHISRYDRMIGHMKQAGWLDKLSGIVLGEFLNTQDNAERPFGFTIEDIIKNSAPNTLIISNAAFGHGDKLCTLPIGANITLKNNRLSFKPLS
jgi:muramoyltetrapeptide carboxypeptidase